MRKILNIALPLVLFAGLIYFVGLKDLIFAFSNLSFVKAWLLIIISVLLIYVSALKWSYFLDAFGSRVPVLRLFNLYVLGYFFNLIAPSYIGGDAARSYYIGKSVGQHKAAAATILERYTGLLAMSGLAVAFVWAVKMVTTPIVVVVVGIFFALLFVTALALSDASITIIGKVPLLKRLVRHFAKIQEGFRVAKSNKALLAKAFLLSLFFHTVTVLNVLAAGYGVGWYNAPVLELFVVLPIILLLGALPITPNSLGIQEGAYLFFLTGLGASPEQALGIALILRAKAYLIGLCGGLVWLYNHYSD